MMTKKTRKRGETNKKVMALVEKGFSVSDIAKQLDLDKSTVSKHISRCVASSINMANEKPTVGLNECVAYKLKGGLKKALEAKLPSLKSLKPQVAAYKALKPIEDTLNQFESNELRVKSKKALEGMLDAHTSGEKVLTARDLCTVVTAINGIANSEDKKVETLPLSEQFNMPLTHIYCDVNNLPDNNDIDLSEEWKQLTKGRMLGF